MSAFWCLSRRQCSRRPKAASPRFGSRRGGGHLSALPSPASCRRPLVFSLGIVGVGLVLTRATTRAHLVALVLAACVRSIMPRSTPVACRKIRRDRGINPRSLLRRRHFCCVALCCFYKRQFFGERLTRALFWRRVVAVCPPAPEIAGLAGPALSQQVSAATR